MKVLLDTGQLDLAEGVLDGPAGPVRLSAMERRLLAYLAERVGEVVTQEELLEEVWGYARDTQTRTVPTTINRLRAKLERDPRAPRHLLTEHGFGYRWTAAPQAEAAGAWVQWDEAAVREALGPDAPARVVEALDGWAPAVQLARALVPLLGWEALAARLDDGLLWLEDAHDPARSARQRVAAAVEALRPEDRAAVGALAVFDGVFHAEVAEQVCGVGLGSLGRLLEAGLVRREGDGLRLARAVAEWGTPYPDVRSRHRAWLASRDDASVEDLARACAGALEAGDGALAEGLLLRLAPLCQGPERARAVALAAEVVELRPTAPVALCALRLLRTLGRFPEAAVWGRRAEVLAPDDPTILVERAYVEALEGRLAEARDMCTQVLARADGDPHLLERAHRVLARVARVTGDLDESRRELELALAHLRAPDALARLLVELGETCIELGDVTAARGFFRRVDAAAIDEGVQAFVAWKRASLHLACADHRAAEADAAEAMQRYHALGDARGEALATQLRGAVRLQAGDLEGAEHDLRRALVWGNAHDPAMAAWFLAELSMVLAEQGLHTAARATLDQARAAVGSSGSLLAAAVTLVSASVALVAGDRAAARARAEAAEAAFGAGGARVAATEAVALQLLASPDDSGLRTRLQAMLPLDHPAVEGICRLALGEAPGIQAHLVRALSTTAPGRP